jgi:hypothetical protein
MIDHDCSVAPPLVKGKDQRVVAWLPFEVPTITESTPRP